MSDKEKALYTRTARGFEPVNDLSHEFWKGCKLGKLYELKGSKPRNAIFHKLYWVLLGEMSRNSHPFVPVKQMDFMAKVGTGTGEWKRVRSPKTGEMVPVFFPGSISFAAMDETEFRRFVREAATFLCEAYLPGVVPDHFIVGLEQLAI